MTILATCASCVRSSVYWMSVVLQKVMLDEMSQERLVTLHFHNNITVWYEITESCNYVYVHLSHWKRCHYKQCDQASQTLSMLCHRSYCRATMQKHIPKGPGTEMISTLHPSWRTALSIHSKRKIRLTDRRWIVIM